MYIKRETSSFERHIRFLGENLRGGTFGAGTWKFNQRTKEPVNIIRGMMDEDDAVNGIRAMLEGAKAPVTDECCIYQVPIDIRKLNEDAYTPKVVSIGPFHHNRPRLQNMERYKLIYCKAFLERSHTSLVSWIRYIEGVEPKVRCCYSEALEFTKEELVRIIFLDCGFIFELFWRTYYDEWSGKNDTFLLKPWLTTSIRIDLLLLENQLPFFVLENLFNLSYASGPDAAANKKIPSFLDFTFDYFIYYNKSNLKSQNISIKHFTDLIRIFHLPYPLHMRRESDESTMHLPSATELSEAGVKFKVNAQSNSLLDLRFSGRVLEIPQLKVEDWTECLFRNMVALEQCHYPAQSYFTDYVAILDFLVNTSRDVDLLVRKRVLVNWLGDSGSVAHMFNGLWKNITHVNFSSHYFYICNDLNAFCRNPLHKLNSTLRRDYFNTPWQTAVSIAGIVLLILSLVQTVCSIMQVMPQS
ncbi:unnamed protein product [Sphenostylis stenocarpa]|uniref:Uncharacterized protein n=1 Tax=Sphenostylis stenocarpa TaxID=92480 RepID=A0AA86VVD2_9FABA|nr:unnamed protein product [Sphenostylis stenocarpa]